MRSAALLIWISASPALEDGGGFVYPKSVETRILGCLLEKERITPENYPLSLNSLIAACNQSTNRDPITAYDARTVEAALDGLRQKKLAVMIMSAGSRVAKFRHELLNHFELSPREVALLSVLLLRGPQTLGELRSRTERMQFFDSLEQVESFLGGSSQRRVASGPRIASQTGSKGESLRAASLRRAGDALKV